MRTPTSWLVVTSLLVAAAIGSPALAAIPTTIPLIGSLRTTAGMPTPDGDYTLEVKLWPTAKGGVAIWAEGLAIVTVKAGAFQHALGLKKPLAAALLPAGGKVWLGVTVGKDPELPRVPLRSTAFALRAALAEGLQCSGCLKGSHLAPASVAADRVAFPYAGAKTKAGPATLALDLACTGCVSVKELKFDGDLDLGGNSLKAKQIGVELLTVGKVMAATLQGDGSKITGIKTPAGSCKAGQVVRGIKADGSLDCVSGGELPADGLAKVSNGLLTNQFIAKFSSVKTPVPISDNSPTGVADELDIPDIGLAQKFSISLSLTNSNIKDVSVTLYDPKNVAHLLYDKGGTGKTLKATWPTPDKPVSAKLGDWVGANPKGKWRLKVVDVGFTNNKTDGAVTGWSLQFSTLSASKVAATGKMDTLGLLSTKGGLQLQVASGPPVACATGTLGYIYLDSKAGAVMICTGKSWHPIAIKTMGTQNSPAKSCRALLNKAPITPDGVYWIDPSGSGNPFQVRCDMSTDGGGWTLVAYAGKINGSKKATVGANNQMLFHDFGAIDVNAQTTRKAFSRLNLFGALMQADSRFMARRTGVPKNILIWPVANPKAWQVDKTLPAVKFLRMSNDGKTFHDRTNNLSVFSPGKIPKYTGYNWNTPQGENCDNCGRSFGNALNHRSLLYWEPGDKGYAATQWFHGSPMTLTDSKSPENSVQDIEFWLREP